jgi:hypothetical protein
MAHITILFLTTRLPIFIGVNNESYFRAFLTPLLINYTVASEETISLTFLKIQL